LGVGDASAVWDKEVSSLSSLLPSGEIASFFGFPFPGEGEDIRTRFFPDSGSDVKSESLVGVDAPNFKSSNLRLMSLTIAQAVRVSKHRVKEVTNFVLFKHNWARAYNVN
jgi:hypothetical protein